MKNWTLCAIIGTGIVVVGLGLGLGLGIGLGIGKDDENESTICQQVGNFRPIIIFLNFMTVS